jgi:hypothetical protein
MRERRAVRGIRVLQIELCAEEFALYQSAREKPRGPIAGAAKRMLLTGAKFVANSGTPRGKKFKRGAGALKSEGPPAMSTDGRC